jgi:TolB-like protein/Flp pilus assembly protein TadD
VASFFKELTRRNVHKVAVGYLAVGWLLTEIMGTALPAIDAPEWVSKAILLLFLIGLPFVLWFSWEFEITDEGIKRTHEVSATDSLTDKTGRKIDFAIIGVLVVAVGWLLSDKFLGDDVAAPAATVTDVADIESIAVLPFEDFSTAGDQANLAVGLSDSILHMLAQVDGLRVAARTSSFSFQGQGADIATIGGELGVAAVLEGSVQRSGDTLRIIAQLIRTSDQTHLWSETFDRPTGEIFAIQDEIANAVVAALRPAGGDAGGAALTTERTSVEAFEHFSRGNALWQRRNLADIEAAIDAFQEALRLDPDYADANAGLAMAYLFSTYYGARETDEVQLVVEQAIDRALTLDPDNALSFGARGLLSRDLNRTEEAVAAYRRAIELNPNDAYPYVWLSGVLGGDIAGFDEAISLVERAYDLDPRNVFVMGVYAGQLAQRGDYEGALAIYRRSITLEPDSPRPYSNIAGLHQQFGRLDDAVRARLAEIERAPESPGPYVNIAGSLLTLGDQEAAEHWMAEARARNPNQDYWTDWYLAPEHHAKLIALVQRLLADDPEVRGLQANLAYALQIAGREEEALEQAIETFTADDGSLDLEFQVFPAIQVAVWQWSADDPRRLEMMNWLDGVLAHIEAAGVQDGNFISAKAVVAALKRDRDAAIANLREAITRGDRQLQNYRYEPWWQQYEGDPEFDALVTELETTLARQRASLRVEGI